jgi:hypothetical protein
VLRTGHGPRSAEECQRRRHGRALYI